MRVILSSRGSRGDVEPLAALGVQLQALGAEVQVLAPPDREFADLLAGVGVPHLPVFGAVRDLVVGIASGKIPPMAGGLHAHATELIAAHSEALMEAAKGVDAIVATGLFPSISAAQAVSERLGIPFASAFLQPTGLPSPSHAPHPMPGFDFPADVTDNRELWELDIQKMSTIFGPSVNAHRESLGLAPVANVRDHTYGERRWLATDAVLSPWDPAYVEVEQTGAWVLPDERPLSAELEAFLDAGEPPVYVGFGSMPWRTLEDAAQVALESVRAHGRRAVILSGWAELALSDAGDDYIVVGEVNQQALFRRVAAIVHHGGAGTTHTATASGAPQVVVPQIVDQPYWAGRVAALGAGVAHEGATPTVASLTAALETALSPETAARAREVAGRIRTDGAAVAAKLVQDMVG
jgi:vancomycin aglycone glucosyltransferase